jgi:hypothetical protein
MYNLQNKNFPIDMVKMCTKNVCVEARGNNAKLLVNVFAITILCIGFAALAKAS